MRQLEEGHDMGLHGRFQDSTHEIVFGSSESPPTIDANSSQKGLYGTHRLGNVCPARVSVKPLREAPWYG